MASDINHKVTWHCTGYLSPEEHDKIARVFWAALAKAAAHRDHLMWNKELVNHRKRVLTPVGGVCKWRRS